MMQHDVCVVSVGNTTLPLYVHILYIIHVCAHVHVLQYMYMYMYIIHNFIHMYYIIHDCIYTYLGGIVITSMISVVTVYITPDGIFPVLFVNTARVVAATNVLLQLSKGVHTNS